MKLPIKGIIPPMVTPLLDNTTIDDAGLEKLIEHLIEGGVHGLFILGTTGEAPHLTYELREEFIEKACKLINKRVPVMVGITDTCMEGALRIANCSKDAGADMVVIAPPYYVPIEQDEFIEYLEALVPQLPLPFMMYNMPSCTKMHMSVDTIKKAKDLGAIGVKDSSGNAAYLYSLIEAFRNDPEFSVIAGSEIYLPETMVYGGHGAVAGGANLFPKVFAELYEAAEAKDMDKVKELRAKMIAIENKVYNVGPYTSKYIKTIKCALSAMGICSDYVAKPFTQFGEKEKTQIKQNLQELDF